MNPPRMSRTVRLAPRPCRRYVSNGHCRGVEPCTSCGTSAPVRPATGETRVLGSCWRRSVAARRWSRARQADCGTRARARAPAQRGEMVGSARSRGCGGSRPRVGRFAHDPSRAGPSSRGCGGLRPRVGRFAPDPSRAGPRSRGLCGLRPTVGRFAHDPSRAGLSEPGAMRIASHSGTLRARRAPICATGDTSGVARSSRGAGARRPRRGTTASPSGSRGTKNSVKSSVR